MFRDKMATQLTFLPRNCTPLVPQTFIHLISLLNTHYMQDIVLGAAIFEMTKLFVQVGSELLFDSVPDLIETECPHMAHLGN